MTEELSPTSKPQVSVRTLDPEHDLPPEVFIIRNLDTGESVDLRDTNKETFTENFAKVLALESPQRASSILEQTRRLNQELWDAAQRNNFRKCYTLLSWEHHPNAIAQVNSRGLYDWTALHIAANNGFIDTCRVLIEEGEMIDIEAQTSAGQTALHLACQRGHLPIAQILIEEGANVNATDNQLYTPLHLASQNGRPEILVWLMQNGAAINALDAVNKTPIDIAASYDIVQLIEEYCNMNQITLVSAGYARTPFNNIVIPNSRLDQINKLLRQSNHGARGDIRKAQVLNRLEGNRSVFESVHQAASVIEESPHRMGPQDFIGLSILGKGSFGSVFLMRKANSEQLYAVKILDKDKVFSNNLIRYAFTERNILQKIAHPFIVKLNYAFQTPKKLAIVMDYIEGGDLGRLLHQQKKQHISRLSEEMARIYAAEIALAIGELHRNGIVFRDLKPENVVLDSNGHAHLTDFGLSKEGIYYGQMSRSFCGSVAYLAPEMIRRRGHDKSVDWYLLGVLLYEMLQGKPPYYSADREKLYYNIQRAPLMFSRQISQVTEDFIRRMMDRNPRRRLGFGPDDVEEVKMHAFFNDIDWNKLYNKGYSLLEPNPPRRIYRDMNPHEIFGELDEVEGKRIEDWSILESSQFESLQYGKCYDR